ncbi:MAG: ATP-binding cassette domain-containing protein [Victivallales bacterium]|nr:ATP-binding cassette domain-containing protein [Victivallales bacterium]
MDIVSLMAMTYDELLKLYPMMGDFFSSYGLPEPDGKAKLRMFFNSLDEHYLLEVGTSLSMLREHFLKFITHLSDFDINYNTVRSMEIIGGFDKQGRKEDVRLKLEAGDILSIVGPTGAGKSRLLEDIECLAQGDTPTRRRILINGAEPEENIRFGVDNRLVAQLSQNMNFVVDLCVADFLTLHAESRMVDNPHIITERIFQTANELAGEKFTRSTPVTALSGGQSRALMIADTACLSRSPVVLIDEIENAGVDRSMALELLIQQEKIVLLVTHDPLLALMAPRRLVIRDGGMRELLQRSEAELVSMEKLKTMTAGFERLRKEMRQGSELKL